MLVTVTLDTIIVRNTVKTLKSFEQSFQLSETSKDSSVYIPNACLHLLNTIHVHV